MADNDWKSRLGMVYSTDPGFNYETDDEPEAETLPAGHVLFSVLSSNA